ncbi:hypothetical protein CANARDRAFT_20623 [[Candida] arabinofermentans NRRL YB-2248]|uniref:Uncharacterized protein n=1 Tax=[Candida] arabinofermentans NRRL YB-2248 TaxID=983967 RepID=A0A1E4T824_9ASCO|nr:hypothetical protein CANARDRAFT_20623 [[Candida] arabinofermentans NRRL YB-2248]
MSKEKQSEIISDKVNVNQELSHNNRTKFTIQSRPKPELNTYRSLDSYNMSYLHQNLSPQISPLSYPQTLPLFFPPNYKPFSTSQTSPIVSSVDSQDNSIQHHLLPGPHFPILPPPSLQYTDNTLLDLSNENLERAKSQNDHLVRLARRKKDLKKLQNKKTLAANIKSSAILGRKTQEQTKTGKTLKAPKTKLQGRPLAPKTKIRLTLVPSLPYLYALLVTAPNTKGITVLSQGSSDKPMLEDELDVGDNNSMQRKRKYTKANNQQTEENYSDSGPMKSQTTIFIEPSYSSELLKSTNRPLQTSKIFPSAVLIEEKGIPVYDSVDTAIKEIFDIEEFSLLRVSRAAALEPSGAIVLKIETARPGDLHLNDDEFDMRYNSIEEKDNDDILLGKPGDAITPTFLKKKVARPRYKSDMRIYLLPRSTSAILYAQEIMLKRDIVNKTLNLETDKRIILCAFDYKKVLEETGVYKGLSTSSELPLDLGSRQSQLSYNDATSLGGLMTTSSSATQTDLSTVQATTPQLNAQDYYNQIFPSENRVSFSSLFPSPMMESIQAQKQQQGITRQNSDSMYRLSLPALSLPMTYQTQKRQSNNSITQNTFASGLNFKLPSPQIVPLKATLPATIGTGIVGSNTGSSYPLSSPQLRGNQYSNEMHFSSSSIGLPDYKGSNFDSITVNDLQGFKNNTTTGNDSESESKER